MPQIFRNHHKSRAKPFRCDFTTAASSPRSTLLGTAVRLRTSIIPSHTTHDFVLSRRALRANRSSIGDAPRFFLTEPVQRIWMPVAGEIESVRRSREVRAEIPVNQIRHRVSNLEGAIPGSFARNLADGIQSASAHGDCAAADAHGGGGVSAGPDAEFRVTVGRDGVGNAALATLVPKFTRGVIYLFELNRNNRNFGLLARMPNGARKRRRLVRRRTPR